MKNLLKVFFIMSLVTVVIFYACQKDSQSQTVVSAKAKEVNPFAFVGQLHNEGLVKVDSAKQAAKEFSPKLALEVATKFAAEKGYPSSVTLEYLRQRVTDTNGDLITDHKALFKKLRETERGLSLRSVNTLDVVETFMDGLDQQQDLASALAYVSTFENGIETGYYSNEEKQYFQMITATATSSLQYWSQNYDGYNVSGEGGRNQAELRGRCGFWCWLCVAWYDTMGAAMGGVGCGPGCAIAAGVMFSAVGRCCPKVCSKDGCIPNRCSF